MKLWAVFIVFLVGIGFGVAGVIYGPTMAEPYLTFLPEALRPETTTIEGTVKAKQRDASQVLLRIETPQGVILATFKNKMREIDLLVMEGDRITLSLREYRPFVEDPRIRQVKKQKF